MTTCRHPPLLGQGSPLGRCGFSCWIITFSNTSTTLRYSRGTTTLGTFFFKTDQKNPTSHVAVLKCPTETTWSAEQYLNCRAALATGGWMTAGPGPPSPWPQRGLSEEHCTWSHRPWGRPCLGFLRTYCSCKSGRRWGTSDPALGQDCRCRDDHRQEPRPPPAQHPAGHGWTPSSHEPQHPLGHPV